MKFCQDHWDDLRAKIAERGLEHLVSKGGAEAAQRTREGGFDPLMNAHNAIVVNAMNRSGVGVLFDLGCPLCRMISRCKCGLGDECHFRKWTANAADGQLQLAKERGSVADG